jgi:hypothetical protein
MKVTLEVDSDDLQQFQIIAKIRGVPLPKVLEEEICWRAKEIRANNFDEAIIQFFAGMSFASRRQAEAVAQRLEEYAIELISEDDSGSGTVAVEVVQQPDGLWGLDINYLQEQGRPWRKLSIGGFSDNDDSEDEEWKA